MDMMQILMWMGAGFFGGLGFWFSKWILSRFIAV